MTWDSHMKNHNKYKCLSPMVVFAKPWLMNQRGNPAKKNYH